MAKRKAYLRKKTTKKKQYAKYNKKEYSISRAASGYQKVDLTYDMSIYCGFDSNYKPMIFLNQVRNTSNTLFVTVGSNSETTPGTGSANTYTQGAFSNGYSPPIIMSLGHIMGAAGSSSCAFAEMIQNYKYWKISNIKLKAQSTLNPIAGMGTNTSGVSQALPLAFLSALPNLYFNISDNTGSAYYGSSLTGILNYDINPLQTARPPTHGWPQRAKSSMKFCPSAQNQKYPTTANFKLGSWCFPTQYCYGTVTSSVNASVITLNGLGRWNDTFCYGINDPQLRQPPWINGSIDVGFGPMSESNFTLTTNYQNAASQVAELQIVVTLELMGKFDYNYTIMQ